MYILCDVRSGHVRVRGEAPLEEGADVGGEPSETHSADARLETRSQRDLQGDHRAAEHRQCRRLLPTETGLDILVTHCKIVGNLAMEQRHVLDVPTRTVGHYRP